MINEPSTIYKLTILYMLNKLDSQISRRQLSNFFVNRKYTDYFHLNSILSDLAESGFIERTEIRNTSYFNITPDGYDSLTFFKSQIPKGMLSNADEFLEENKLVLRAEVGTFADFYKHTNGDFICNLKIMEGKSLLYELNISVPAIDDAERICNNWEANSENIYAYIMKTLLS